MASYLYCVELLFLVYREPEIIEPCHPSPCGANALCKEKNNAGSCRCLPDYYGDPYVECRPECTMNSDCPSQKSCVNQKCINPCIGICGSNAECYVANHSPYCTCSNGFTGNPSVACYEIPKSMLSFPNQISFELKFYSKIRLF